MKWALKVDRGKRKGMIIAVQKSPFLIGRNNECQLRAASLYVSDRHCELRTEDDKLVVRDCNSTNGTFINSHRIQGEFELHEGDRLEAGALAFVVCHGDLIPIEEEHFEPAHPKPPRPVEEDAVEDILLELDGEDTGPEPGAWRNMRAEDVSSKPGHARERKRAKVGPKNELPPGPSDVAKALLNGQGGLLKRRS